MIARCQMLDRTADRGDDTRPLMTIDGRIRHLGIAVAGVQIRVTDTGGRDPD